MDSGRGSASTRLRCANSAEPVAALDEKRQTGKVKLNLAITYTPTGGDPSTQSVKVKLKKKL